MKIMLIAAALVVTLTIHATAAETSAKTCEATAVSWFKSAHGDGKRVLKNGRTVQTSKKEAHYNAKRKQCLVRTVSDTPAKGDSPELYNTSIFALEAKETKILGSFVRVGGQVKHCLVDGKKCQTEQEWDVATAPLMKE